MPNTITDWMHANPFQAWAIFIVLCVTLRVAVSRGFGE